jgi:PKD repeat protein
MKHLYKSLALALIYLCSNIGFSQNQITLTLLTDCWGGEVSWSLANSSGTVLGSVGTNTLGNQQTTVTNFDLPDGCYTFTINDSYGDGMNGTAYGSCGVNGNYTIVDAGSNVLVQMGIADYDFQSIHPFSVGSTLGCTDPNANNYNDCAAADDGSCVYPVLTSNFSFDASNACGVSTVPFTNLSEGNIVSYAWSFPGGSPSASSDENPVVTYATDGTYSATLLVTDNNGDTSSLTQDVIIASGDLLEIVIVPDNYPTEISWNLVDENGVTLGSGGSTGATFCIADNCHLFTINDSYGDGICCAYGTGSYTIYLNGVQVATGGNYGTGETVNINCPPGSDCNNTIAAVIGEQTAPYPNAWYSFTPDQNGQYRITTCNRATCDTKIWVYDYCNMNLFDDTNEATLTYNDDFCGVQAEITPFLEGGVTYYIRIGDTGSACSNDPIDFAVEYLGPIPGCMDPAACNYLPIAGTPTQCYFEGDPECPTIGPDLAVLGDVFYSSMFSTTLTNNDACYVNEGCMQGFGSRQILRFTTHIKNIGTEDYFIGAPSAQPGQFEWDVCHNHWHYEGYAEYVLYDGNGQEMPQIGFKNGFCVLDLECSDGGTAKYTCGNMGITAGCGDIYSSGLSCQWVDITDVPAGSYTLVIRTNWDHSPDANGSYELTYSNNYAAVCISFDRDANNNIINFVKDQNCPLIYDCLGVPFGSTQPDCAANCPGIIVKGDVNGSGSLEPTDASQYVQEILGNDAVVTDCTDMDSDNNITVTDAALIAGCSWYGPDYVDPSGVHNHCIWDVEFVDPNHMVTLSIGDINLAQNYIDIHVLNPDNEIVGYEFTVSGFTILSVENLIDPAVYDINAQASLGGNKVIGLSYDGMMIPKNLAPAPMVRIYYQSLTSSMVCVSSIVDIVNESYHNTLTTTGPCTAVAGLEFADFSAFPTTVCAGGAVQFTDLSTNGTNSWAWSFSGGSPASSSTQNPTVTYFVPGTYAVTLTASNGTENDGETKAAYITVVANETWYADNDNDGYGDENNSVSNCTQPSGYLATAGDCDDSRADVYPGAIGTGENIDNDCNGVVEFDEVSGCPGDFNNDGVRDIGDLLTLLQYYGCTGNCDPGVDLNNDGTVNGSDMLDFLSYFGLTCL